MTDISVNQYGTQILEKFYTKPSSGSKKEQE